MKSNDLKINLKVVTDASDVKSNIDQLQQLFNKLSKTQMPWEQKNEMGQNISKIKQAYEKLQTILDKPNKTTSDLKQIPNLLKSIENETYKFSNSFGKIDIGDLGITAADSKLNELQSNVAKTQNDLRVAFDNSSERVQNLTSALQSSASSTTSKNLREVIRVFNDDNTTIDEKSEAIERLYKSLSRIDESVRGQIKDALDVFTGKNADTGKIDQLVRAYEEAGIAYQNANIQAQEEAQTAQEATAAKIAASAATEEYSQQLQLQTQEQIQATNTMQNLTNKLLYFVSAANGLTLLRRMFQQTYQAVKELDAAMTEMAVVTTSNVSDYWDQLPEYTQRAYELGASIQDLYEASTLYYQQGLNTQQVNELTTATMKMARIASLDAAEATDRMTNALRGFNMELTQTNADNVADVYSKLAAISAADVDEISTAMTKVASIANSANMEFATTSALLTQIIETTRESAETAGTALKTVIARFSEVKQLYNEGQLVGNDAEGEEIDVNNVSKALRIAGIDLNKYLTGAKGLDDIFLELASKWDSLDLVTQRYIATMAAGSRQQSRFIAMMQDYDRTLELVNASQNASGAATEQFNKTLDSLEAKLNQLKTQWQAFTTTIFNEELIKKIIDALTKLLSILNKITGNSGLGKIAVSVGLFATLKKAVQGVVGSISKITQTASANAKTTKNLTTNLNNLANKFSTVAKAMSMAGIKDNTTATAKETVLKWLNVAATDAQIASDSLLTIILNKLKISIKTTAAAFYEMLGAILPIAAPFIALAAAIGAVVFAVKKANDTNNLTSLTEKLNDQTEAADEETNKLNELTDSLAALNDEIDELNSKKIGGTISRDELNTLEDNIKKRKILLAQLDSQKKKVAEANAEVQASATKILDQALNNIGRSSTTNVARHEVGSAGIFNGSFTDEAWENTQNAIAEMDAETLAKNQAQIQEFYRLGYKQGRVTFSGMMAAFTDSSDDYTIGKFLQLENPTDKEKESFSNYMKNLLGEDTFTDLFVNAAGEIDWNLLKNSLDGYTETLTEILTTTSAASATSKLEKLSEATEDLTDAASELNEQGFINPATIQNLNETFNLTEEQYQLLQSGGEEAFAVLDELCNKYIEQNKILSELNESNADYYISVLKNNNVSNAEIVVKRQLIANQLVELSNNNKLIDSNGELTVNLAYLAEQTGWTAEQLAAYAIQQKIAAAGSLEQALINDANGMIQLASYTAVGVQALAKLAKVYQEIQNIKNGKVTNLGLIADLEQYQGTKKERIAQAARLLTKTGQTGLEYLENYAASASASIMAQIEELSFSSIGATYNRNVSDTANSAADAWENSFDRLYNLVAKLQDEQKTLNNLQADYDNLIRDTNKNAQDLTKNLQAQTESLNKQKEIQKNLLQGRQLELEAGLLQYADVGQYVTVIDGVIQIDYGAIAGITDSDTYERVEEAEGYYSRVLEDIQNCTTGLDEIDDSLYEINKKQEEVIIDVESDIRDRIIKQIDQEIDALNKNTEAINKTNTDLISAINNQLAQVRQDRSNQKTEDSLNEQRRRLAYLRQDTSGANALAIKELEKSLSEAEQDYTDTLIDQKISELEAQNEKAAEQREEQIKLLEDQRDYLQESGKINDEVQKLIQEGLDSTGAIIIGSDLNALLNSTSDLKEKSATELASYNEDLAQKFKEFMAALLFTNSGITKYATGGLADFTGPAWLDGSVNRPEMVLNAKDTENFLQLRDILSKSIGNVSGNQTFGGDAYYNFNIQVDQLANDYDVDQLVKRVTTKITESSKYRNINAINLIR